MMSREYRVGEFFIRVNWLIAAFVLITSITFLNLGIWQLGRAAEKVEEQEALDLQIANQRAQYIEKFTAMETAVSSFKKTGEFLDNLIKSLNSSN